MGPDRRLLTLKRDEGRRVWLEVQVESDNDLAALEGALLAARAAELSQIRRRGDRLAFGYGSDTARETMNDEVDHAERRWMMLGRLLESLKTATRRDTG
jgi:hypothetical protein